MIDSAILIIVGLVGILTPFIVLSFGLAMLIGIYSVLNAACKSLTNALNGKRPRLPQKEVKGYKTMPQCPREETAHGAIPKCTTAA